METFIRVFQASFDGARAIDWPAAMQRLITMSKKSKDAMCLALTEGWFFGWHDGLSSLLELLEKLEVTDPSAVDDVMAKYYRLNLQPFTRELVAQYPDRAAPINAAVNAHMSPAAEGYFLSIPVFIAQADGLLSEIIEVELPIPKAAKIISEKYADDPKVLDLLYPFIELNKSHFMMSAKARKEVTLKSGNSFTPLNRHQVMHGERSDYGTEINSLKAFSFMVCVGLHMPLVMDSYPTPASHR
jgi:hypothetical protein